jgi:hypothetical protein
MNVFSSLQPGDDQPPPRDRSGVCHACSRRAFDSFPDALRRARSVNNYSPLKPCPKLDCPFVVFGRPACTRVLPKPEGRSALGDSICLKAGGKVRYATQSLALSASDATRFVRRAGRQKWSRRPMALRAYRCAHCGDWHNTKKAQT